MTKEEFNGFFLEASAAFPFDIRNTPETAAAWARAVRDCDVRKCLRYIREKAKANSMSPKIPPTPGECRRWAKETNGCPPLLWKAVKRRMLRDAT